MTKTKNLTSAAVRKFQKMILGYYWNHGRNLPWRLTRDPYKILVSEIMLQQTQVQRVLGKYETFIKEFPGFSSLARAPLRLILKEWQGLGYNRRAIALKQIAQKVMGEFQGHLPVSTEVLITFPGIGRATASAIAAFAYCQPVVFIETNIRRVFIHSFFHDRVNIRDDEILPLIAETLDAANPREWYYALMDYGVLLKKETENPNRRSAHYQKQSPFQGSNRQMRGAILKELTRESSVSVREVAEKLGIRPEDARSGLEQLRNEGFIRRVRGKYTIA